MSQANKRILQHRLRNQVGVGQYVGVMLGAANRLDDALAHTGNDRFFRGAADEAIQLGAHCHAGTGFELDAVLAHPVQRGPALGRIGTVNDFGVHAGSNGVEDVAAGQVNRRGDPPG